MTGSESPLAPPLVIRGVEMSGRIAALHRTAQSAVRAADHASQRQDLFAGIPAPDFFSPDVALPSEWRPYVHGPGTDIVGTESAAHATPSPIVVQRIVCQGDLLVMPAACDRPEGLLRKKVFTPAQADTLALEIGLHPTSVTFEVVCTGSSRVRASVVPLLPTPIVGTALSPAPGVLFDRFLDGLSARISAVADERARLAHSLTERLEREVRDSLAKAT